MRLLFPALLLALQLAARADQADDCVLAQLKHQHIPAASIAVVTNGECWQVRGRRAPKPGMPSTPTPARCLVRPSTFAKRLADERCAPERDGGLPGRLICRDRFPMAGPHPGWFP